MIGYIYKNTNLINGKIYIGQHQGSKFDKKYYGSGKYIKRAIKKYGIENFKVIILYRAKTFAHLNEAEIIFIDEYNSTNKKIGYNISLGGDSGFRGGKHTNRAKLKNSLAHIGVKLTQETKDKISKYQMGRPKSEETKFKIALSKIGNNYNLGSKRSPETRLKMSNARKGMKFSKSHRMNLSLYHADFSKEKHPFFGKKHTEEAKAKMSACAKGRPWSEKRRRLFNEKKYDK